MFRKAITKWVRVVDGRFRSSLLPSISRWVTLTRLVRVWSWMLCICCRLFTKHARWILPLCAWNNVVRTDCRVLCGMCAQFVIYVDVVKTLWYYHTFMLVCGQGHDHADALRFGFWCATFVLRATALLRHWGTVATDYQSASRLPHALQYALLSLFFILWSVKIFEFQTCRP